MLIQVKVKTLDSQTYDFDVDDETTILQFKDLISEKTGIAANLQRIIYCGRVLVDEKPLKEYDVNGKVVHVVERLPPSTCSPSTPTGNTANRPRTTTARTTGRGTDILRSLDGMLVGSFSLPVNGSNVNVGPTQQTMSHLTPSTSFCMNRITVARHMLNCANNIAAYLEDPERGLNNTELDILSQGRWTMESTVVEVGITADVDNDHAMHSQSIAEALEGILTNALRHNGHTGNVTVVEVPAFIPAESGPSGATSSAEAETVPVPTVEPTTSAPQAEAREDTQAQIEVDPDESNEQSSTSSTGGIAGSEAGSTNTAADGEEEVANAQRRQRRQSTRTQVLARVVEFWRAVQTRLDPFIQQYYDILLNDPATNETGEDPRREHLQRVYDRVTEALHYMAHAQHAISDLMLNLSQPAPRFLTCRPILVEQSGFVSSNNYLAAFPAGANAASATATTSTPGTPTSTAATATSTQATNNNVVTTNANDATITVTSNTSTVSSGEPSTATPDEQSATTPTEAQSTQANGNSTRNRIINLGSRRSTVTNPTTSTNTAAASATVGAVNSGAEIGTVNPNIITVGITPTGQLASASFGRSNSASESATTPTEAQSTQANGNSTRNRIINLGSRRSTVTNPTTSTNTRSTSRPHVHIGNAPPGWNSRVMNGNIISSFDRFLPCSSHHIRNSGEPSNNNEARVVHSRNPLITTRHLPRTRYIGPNRVRLVAGNNSNIERPFAGQTIPRRTFVYGDTTRISALSTRDEFRQFAQDNFKSMQSLSDDNLKDDLNLIMRWFENVLVFLPQYSLASIDARASVEGFLKKRIPKLLKDLHTARPRAFIDYIMETVCQLKKLLITTIGSANTSLFWDQVDRTLFRRFQETSSYTCLIQFQRALMRNYYTQNELQQADVCSYIVMKKRSQSEGERGNTSTPSSSRSAPSTAGPPSSSAENRMEYESDSSSGHEQLNTENKNTLNRKKQMPNWNDPSIRTDFASQEWHDLFPQNWVPLLVQDQEKQSATVHQPQPFSDTYISGMSAKRRKLIQSAKPELNIQGILSQSVKHAMVTTGEQPMNTSNVTPSIEKITENISNDATVQASFTAALTTTIRSRLDKDPNYTSDRFPNIAKYFKK